MHCGIPFIRPVRLVAVLMIVATAGAVHACGPFFPSAFLSQAESPHRAYVDFAFAMLEVAGARNLLPAGTPHFPAGETNTIDADVKDFAARLAEADMMNLSSAERAERVKWYRAAATAVRHPNVCAIDMPVQSLPALREFALYLAGASEALSKTNLTIVPQAWQELLRLPPAQRRYRTTWVLYTSGSIHARAGRVADAARDYQALQDAVAQGFRDRCGLAHASFRREYRDGLFLGLLHRMRTAPKALAYYRMTGDKANYAEILDELYAETQASHLTHDILERIVADPVAREVLVARLADRSGSCSEAETAVLRRIQPESCVGAARMAFLAYRRDDQESTRAWLHAAPSNSLTRLWLEAEMLRRAGHFETAAASYRQWLRRYEQLAAATPPDTNAVAFSANGTIALFRPTPAFDRTAALPYFVDYDISDARTAPQEIQGLLGTTLVHRHDFLEALACFVRADSRVDAAYVAEGFVPLADLRRFVDGLPADPPRRPEQEEESEGGSRLRTDDLRHLLARRMMREKPGPDAVAYFPKALRDHARRLVKALAVADDEQQPRQRRALACYNAARLLRWHGMELVGTELLPDSFYTEGGFFFGVTPDAALCANLPQTTTYEFRPPEYENKPWPGIFRQSPPSVRFHYRIRAADYMRKAAALTPDPKLRAMAIYIGGYWIRLRHADDAKLFAQQLGEMDPKLQLARWIRTHGWFTTSLTPWMSKQADGDETDMDEQTAIPDILLNEPKT